MTRDDNEPNGRQPVPHGVGEPDAIHRARHIHGRKHDLDIVAASRIRSPHGVVCVEGLQTRSSTIWSAIFGKIRYGLAADLLSGSERPRRFSLKGLGCAAGTASETRQAAVN